MPLNVAARFTLQNFALCDATEIFVLLAGYAAGIAYLREAEQAGWLYAVADVLRRVWILYVAHIFLFVVFSAQVSYSATALDRSDYLDEIHLDVLAEAPYRALLEALLLRFQPAYLNILPMYVALLLMFALTLPLARRPAVIGTISLGLYALVRLFGWNLPSWNEGGWYFNPLGWQALFFIGVILSRPPPRLPVPGALVDWAAAAMLLAGAALLWLVWPSDALTARVPPSLARLLLMVDKQSLHPLRLLSMLALVWVAVRLIPRNAAWMRRWPAWPATLCGQHSLPVFCVGIFVSFLGRLAMEEHEGWASQLAVNLLGPAILLGVGLLAAWYRAKGRAQAARRWAAAEGARLPAAGGVGNGTVT